MKFLEQSNCTSDDLSAPACSASPRPRTASAQSPACAGTTTAMVRSRAYACAGLHHQVSIRIGLKVTLGPSCTMLQTSLTAYLPSAVPQRSRLLLPCPPGGTLKKQLGEPTMMPNWDADAAAGKLILERAGLEVFHSPLHLEGGSIHTDGEGCVKWLSRTIPTVSSLLPCSRHMLQICHKSRC